LWLLVNEKVFDKSSKIIVLAGNFGPEPVASYIEICTVENLLKKSA